MDTGFERSISECCHSFFVATYIVECIFLNFSVTCEGGGKTPPNLGESDAKSRKTEPETYDTNNGSSKPQPPSVFTFDAKDVISLTKMNASK